MASVKSLHAEQAFDSDGFPTTRGILELDNGMIVEATIPNGKHPGKFSAGYLYDEEKIYLGQGIQKSIKYINELIAPKIVGADPLKCKQIDIWLTKADSTENKEVLGANTTFLVSILFYKAASAVKNIPLYQFFHEQYEENFEKLPIVDTPSPIFNLISGGAHGSELLNFQEFHIVPSTSKTYAQAYEMTFNIYHELRRVFQYRSIFAGLGNDGAYVPALSSNIDGLEIIKEAVTKFDYKLGLELYYSLDLAADFFYKGKYYLSDSPTPLSAENMIDKVKKLNEEYKFLLLEDALASKDDAGWKLLMQELGGKVFIVADDLTQTNKKQLEHAIANKLCNTVCVKPLQRGTIWETMEFVAGAKKGKLKIVVSQMAAETNDSWVADFAVAMQADFVKFGSVARGERIAKHQRMMQIEKELHV
ncbi:MAG: hypothetical protein NUV65_01175 [Candidatus Roizmanbacteria bacterium]|nr:hypothetical protein [Candidatus Roizmanbacteria bacterium]